MGTSYSPNIVEDGLVFLSDPANPRSYPGSGTVINSLVSTLTSSIQSATFENINNGVFDVDGTDAYLQLPHYVPDSENVTFGIWAKSDVSIDSFKQLWGASTSGGGTDWGISGQSDGTIQFRMRTPSPIHTDVKTTSTPSINEWFYFVGTWDASNLRVYYNGIEENSASATTYVDGGRYITSIGAYVWFQGFLKIQYEWDGQIGPYHIYNRGLSSQEVKQNYNALKSRFI